MRIVKNIFISLSHGEDHFLIENNLRVDGIDR